MVRFNPSRELAGYLRKTLALTEEQEEVAAYSLLILFQTVISLLAYRWWHGWQDACRPPWQHFLQAPFCALFPAAPIVHRPHGVLF
ncbi:hypothetical protein H4I72_26520 (plasmid) [Klebsiella pneumoniae]|nr:hypothetical protein H4I72_26520 [Klebsiella pneumoniae]